MRGPMPDGVSRPDRRTLSIDAVIRLTTGRSLPVTIIDTSRGGCKVRCPEILPIGELVQLEIPAVQPNPASIRWSCAGSAGLRFV